MYYCTFHRIKLYTITNISSRYGRATVPSGPAVQMGQTGAAGFLSNSSLRNSGANMGDGENHRQWQMEGLQRCHTYATA